MAHGTGSQGKLVLLIGPSGVGKSVILRKLRERHPELHFPRSATTRERRPGESDELYRFVDNAAFDRLIEEGRVLEWAVVHGGARYGTLSDEIIPFIEQGRTVVREVDVQGFDSITHHKLFRRPDAPYRLHSMFILPQDRQQLLKHIDRRAPMSEDELKRRLASMEREMTYADLCDVQITNVEGKLQDTIASVEDVIFS